MSKKKDNGPKFFVPEVDLVEHPKHYNMGKYEVIEVLQDWFKDDPLAWQIVKYLSRYRHKGMPIVDLKKAKFYLERLIQERENEVRNSA